jgi:hypothetical protein
MQDQLDRQRLAVFISYALIPPVPSAIAFTLLTLNFQHSNRFTVGLVALLFGSVIPFFIMGLFRRLGKMTAYDAPIRQERTAPYFITVAFYFVGVVLLKMVDASFFVWGLMWCYAINTTILALVNLFWKVSAHVMGIAGPLVALGFVFGKYIVPVFLLVGLAAWARVTVKAHTVPQVIVGALMGIVLTAGQYLFLFVMVGKM